MDYRVLILARTLYPPWTDGDSSYARGLLESILSIKNIEVTTFSSTERKRRPKKDDVESFTSTFRRVSDAFYGPSVRGIANPTDVLRVLFLLNKMKNSKTFDFTHIIYYGLDAYQLMLVLGSKSQKGIIKHINAPAPNSRNALTRATICRLAETTNRIGFCRMRVAFTSECTMKTYGIGRSNTEVCTVIPPAINSDKYKPSSIDEEIVAGIFKKNVGKIRNLKGQKLLYVGSLTYERFPYDIILKALKVLLSEHRDLNLMIVGRGGKNNSRNVRNILRYASRLNLREHIFMAVNPLSEIEKINLLNQTDVFLNLFTQPIPTPPVVDPPIVILEAMSCGKPVVASNMLSIPSIIIHGQNGYLVNTLKVEEVATVINRALDSCDKINDSARRTVVTSFSTSKVASIINKLYSADKS